MPDQTAILQVSIDEVPLREAGYTDTAVLRYKKTVSDFSEELFRRSTQLGEASKAPNFPREITQHHVQSSATELAAPVTARPKPKWFIPAHILEYVCLAIAGIGGGHLDKQQGILAFGIGLTVGVLLIVARLTIVERRN
ncbi:MAG: hypothetical protein LGR52_06655 [Candidatus Thiosymbion ectosymbiont of Robbea hypermnestra]|nr:hypothetical protein [Candidatus Thiosymbion ectosymbiont of Robbea hypermnestra]